MKKYFLSLSVLLFVVALLVTGCAKGTSGASELSDEAYVEAVMNDADAMGLFVGTDAYNLTGEVVTPPSFQGDTCVVRVSFEVLGLTETEEPRQGYLDFTVKADEYGHITLFSPAIESNGRTWNF